MSLCTSSFAFSGHSKDQSFFSSASAFKKPTLSRNFHELPNNCTISANSIHPKDIAKAQAKAIQIIDINEDSDLIMYEPVKKVKSNRAQPLLSHQPNNNKSHQHKTKPLKLTIEDVFDTPIEAKQKKKERVVDECFEEGSSLSFISSYSSLDSLDDESNADNGTKHSDCLILEPIMQNYEVDMQSLVMKDDVVRRLNCLNQESILFNTQESPLVLFPFNQQPIFEHSQFLKTLPVEFGNTEELVCNVPLSIPPNKLNEYIRSTMYNQQFLQPVLNFSDKTIGGFAKNCAEQYEYDSDSYATRSTSVEREMINADSEKTQSPLFGINYDICQQEKISMNKLKVQVREQKTQKAKKQVRRSTNQAEAKEKKGRSLNLQLDLNPKQLKVERRLNRLQLLRYQQGVVEDDEEIKKFGIIEQLSRTNSTNNQESNQCQGETNEARIGDNEIQDSFNQFISECSQTVIPELGEQSARSKRTTLAPKWNPEGLQEEEFELYMQLLGEVLDMRVTNQEIAIRILKTCGMNISSALEAVRDNKALYSETFRVKVKRLRRYGA